MERIHVLRREGVVVGWHFRWAALLIAVGMTTGQGVRAKAANPNAQLSSSQQQKLAEVEKLNAQVLDLTEQGKYKEGLAPAKKALAMSQEAVGLKHMDTAIALNNLGYLYEELGDYAAAKPYYVQALAIRKEVLGLKHPHTALSLSNMGYLLNLMGDYAGAKPYYEQALAIRKEVLGPKHPDTILTLNNLGYLFEDMGDYAAAKPYYEQALALRKEVLGPKHRDTAQSYNNLGALLVSMGNLAAAKPYYEQALAIRKEVLGPKHPDTAVSLNNMGFLLNQMGDPKAAKPYYEQALAINKEVLGPKHPLTATLLDNLGGLLYDMQDLAGAKSYYEQALAIRKEVLGPKHPDTATSLNNMGTLLDDLGDHAGAKSYFEQALAAYMEVLGPKHPLTATALNNLGAEHQALGNEAEAMLYYEQAVAIRKEVFGPKHPETARALDNLTRLDAALGDWANAGKHQRESRQAVRAHVAGVLPALGQKQQLQFIQNRDEIELHRALSLGLHQAEHPPLAGISAEFLINGKAVIQESLAERATLALGANDPAVKKLVQELRATRTGLAALSQTTPKASEAATFRAQLESLDKRERELAVQVSAALGRSAQANPWTELDQVRGGIPKQGVFIDLARFQPYNFKAKGSENPWQTAHYVAWLTPATEAGDVNVIDLGDAAKIEAAVQDFQKAFKPCQNPDQDKNPLLKLGEPAAEKELQASLAALGKLIFDPLQPHLANKTELILSPDSALWLVPWSALPIAEGKYAIEKWNIHYVTSARDLVTQHRKVSSNAARIFANPDYDLDGKAALASLNNILRGIGIPGGPTPSGGLPPQTQLALRSAEKIGRVPKLPATETEAQGIATSLKKLTQAEPKLYLRDQALEGIFKRLSSPRVLILSTHGFFLPDQELKIDDKDRSGLPEERENKKALVDKEGHAIENPLLRCGLLLAGCNTRDTLAKDSPLDDGVLTGMEIAGTDLRGTELVVLSACETGLGKVNNGEGVAGLRQAFQLAGARSVVATLWQIPDRQTAALMNDFFSNQADGQSKSDALRNAQLTLIKARREKSGAAHPFFWAAFTLTGE